MELTAKQKEDIAAKIDNEGFDYYFTDYGPDEVLEKLIGLQIEEYKNARNNLIQALNDIGVETVL